MSMQYQLYAVDALISGDSLEKEMVDFLPDFESDRATLEHHSARKAIECYMEKQRLRSQLTEFVI